MIKDIIDVFYLKNGFNCCIRNTNFFEGYMTMALTVKVGSIFQQKDNRGAAHLLEHVLMSFLTFNLIKNVRYTAKAYTDFNETIFYIKGPSDKNNFLQCLDIILGIVQGKFLEEKYFQRAKMDVLEEIESRHDKCTITDILLRESEYIEYLALGNREDVLKLEFKDIKDFFDKFYSADLMSLAIVGDILDMWKQRKIIEKKFDKIRHFSVKVDKPELSLRKYQNEEYYLEKFKGEKGVVNLNIIYKIDKTQTLIYDNTIAHEIVEKVSIIVLKDKVSRRFAIPDIDIQFECKDFDQGYMFYCFTIITEKRHIREVINVLALNKDNDLLISSLDSAFIDDLIRNFYKIKRNSLQYFKEIGMHQLLLECINGYINQQEILTYEKKCSLYEEKSREINSKDVIDFCNFIQKSEKVFICS